MKFRIIIFFSMFIVNIGCNDWLDVSSRSEMKEEELYQTEDGFKSALTGAYIQLASSDLYGRFNSMFFPEQLTHHWTKNTTITTAAYNIVNFNYEHESVQNLIESIWKKYYQSIVHINNVLENLDKTDVTFRNGNFDMIKGECYGLRGLIHFDLLRMFGPIPDANANGKLAIPYVTEMTKDPNKLTSSSYDFVVESILKDLETAEELLINDPIISVSNSILNRPGYQTDESPEDEWHYYRQNRFNYYAVKAIKARLYLWIGDKTNAVKYAKEVIEATNDDGSLKFTLANESYFSTPSLSDLVYSREHLFAVHNPNLQDLIASYFKESSATLTQTVNNINTAYESGVNPDDIRNKSNRFWEEQTHYGTTKVNHFRKFTGSDTYTSPNTIPVIRLAELYLILIECSELEDSKIYFSEYRISRNLNSSLENEITDAVSILNRLEKEYRKEFFGEGQMFYFYKRNNYPQYTWPTNVTINSDIYVIPQPDSQSVFE